MLCVFIPLVELFVVTLVLAIGAKLASQFYQRRTYGVVDEAVAAGWQNRAALLGIIASILSFVSRFHIYTVSG